MNLRRAIVMRILRILLWLLCKIDDAEYVAAVRGAKEDGTGAIQPMIIAVNHINFLEVPVLVCCAYPTPLVGIIKDTTWNNPLMAFLLDTFNAIPITRGGAYVETFRRVQEMMRQGAFIGIAPEGTRSGDGILRKGRAGIVQLAMLTGAPVLPVAHYGGQNFWRNLRRFRRTPIRFRVGRPFYFKRSGETTTRAERAELADELMGQIAALLPEELRGEYSSGAPCEHLEFL
ncbi:MAG: 1-acyl-sn-glycerol-3-phosphate acyltransferase [Spirochaetaceae bacterium]|jgi:1-acyl-sn-glycerol-3-phosphate acyltransferase|nr:1-acyl-sn-glycerol-3-phosphate acyltransferase [Spirochaetaceae bacterium]